MVRQWKLRTVPSWSLLILALVVSSAAAQTPATGRWEQVEGTRIPVPPAEHPRLYLRGADVAQLGARLRHPAVKPALERWQGLARKSPQFQLEWDALQYLVQPTREAGRAIVERGLELVCKCKLPDRHDACRVTGRMMVTGAMVYDWCYELLTDREKQVFVDELVRLAKTLECGYPPVRQGSITGHSSEAMIMRDLLSAGIAIYDEYPEMYRLAAGRFFRAHLPARNWLYNGHAYHQGDSYGPYRYSWDTFPLFIFDRLGFGNVYNPEQRWVPYYYLYATRPDGQRLRGGDTFMHSTPRGTPWGEGIGTLLTASYYNDPILLGQYLQQGGNRNNEVIFEVLWRSLKLQPKSHDTLPLSRYFAEPFGWMISRTGWGADAVIAEMKINQYNFTNHQHLDAGAFQIYYGGPLAIDSGLYSGSSGQYGSPHCCNYSWRTIAHNCLLIYDPNEQFRRSDRYGNDGGQRLPNGRSEPRDLPTLMERGYHTGDVLSHGCGPDSKRPEFTLLQGDLTSAYNDKVQRVRRSMVFLNLRNAAVPAALIVFDRVVAAESSFKKSWLLHTLEQPRPTSTGAVVDCTQHGNRGRLYLDCLRPMPENLKLDIIGGPGHEFWVFGTNYANAPPADRVARGSYEIGAWRVELSPRRAAEENIFLNVVQVTDQQTDAHLPVSSFAADGRIGCTLRGADGSWTVSLRTDSNRSAAPVRVVTDGAGTCRLLVTDLAAGMWIARHGGDRTGHRIAVTSEQGTAWVVGPAGEWHIGRAEIADEP